MAYIVDYAITENAAGGATSIGCNVPSHQVDDYLVVFVAVNGTGGTHSCSGYTQIGTTQVANTGIGASIWYKKAASGAETATVGITVADDYSIKVICVRDADTTNFLDSGTVISTTTTTTTESTFTSPTMTTQQTNSLVVYYHASDAVTPQVHSGPGVMFLVSSDSTGTTANTSAGSGIAWYLQATNGSTPAPTWIVNAAEDRTNHVFAIRNKTGGRIPAYADFTNTVAESIMEGHHLQTTALNNISFPASVNISPIGPSGTGKTFTYDAGAVTGDYGTNPYSGAIANTPAATAATGVAGFQVTATNSYNFTNSFLVGTIIASTPKMANYNHGSVSQGGTYMVLASGSTANTDYRSYQIAARDSVPNTESRMVFSINPNQTTTAYGTNGNYSPSATTRFLFGSNCPTATITLYTCEWFRVGKITVAGGDTNNPVDAEGLNAVGKSFRIDLFQKSAAAGITAYVPIQIGGGAAVNFQIDAGSLQFPRIYNTTKKEINYHAAPGAIGISYAGKSGDVIKHTNSVVTSASVYYWEINSAATSSATWDFSGLTIVNANVTLRNVMTFNEMTFAACPTINGNGCTITNSTFSKIPAANDSITLNASSNVDYCTFDLTSVTAGNRAMSIADPSIFTYCNFNGSGTSGHAMRLTTAGTYNFTGNKFTNFGATGTNNAAILVDGVAVTLAAGGGGDTSISYRTTNGGSLNITTSVNLTLTGIVVGSDIVILDAGTTTERVNINAHGSSSYVYSFTTGGNVDICLYKQGYIPYASRNFALPSQDGSIPINQVSDRNFSNP